MSNGQFSNEYIEHWRRTAVPCTHTPQSESSAAFDRLLAFCEEHKNLTFSISHLYDKGKKTFRVDIDKNWNFMCGVIFNDLARCIDDCIKQASEALGVVSEK